MARPAQTPAWTKSDVRPAVPRELESRSWSLGDVTSAWSHLRRSTDRDEGHRGHWDIGPWLAGDLSPMLVL